MSYSVLIVSGTLCLIMCCKALEFSYPINDYVVPILDNTQDDYFGTETALLGNTALVSAPNDRRDTRGAVYVFEKGLIGSWSMQARLTSSSNISYALGSKCEMIDEDNVIATDYYSFTGTGLAFTFTKLGGQWTEAVQLRAAEGSKSFAESVSVSNFTILAGSTNPDSYLNGLAYIFERGSSIYEWTQTTTLEPANFSTEFGSAFGQQVSFVGDTIAVNAPMARLDIPGTRTGVAFIFARDVSLGTWTQQSIVTVPENRGCVVDPSMCWNNDLTLLEEDGLAIGGSDHNIVNESGAIFLFSRSGAAWTMYQRLKAPTEYIKEFSSFGRNVAYWNDTIVAGDPDSGDFLGSITGVAHIFKRRPAGTGFWSCTGTLAPKVNILLGSHFGSSVSVGEFDVLAGAKWSGHTASHAGMGFFADVNFEATGAPSTLPSSLPSSEPSSMPSSAPSIAPTSPTSLPSGIPSAAPSGSPSSLPSAAPSGEPTYIPSGAPTGQPTGDPSSFPTGQPSSQPTGQPTGDPSSFPTGQPSGQPTGQPTSFPTKENTNDNASNLGLILGLSLGCGCCCCCLIFLLLLLIRRRKKEKKKHQQVYVTEPGEEEAGADRVAHEGNAIELGEGTVQHTDQANV